MKFTEGKTQDQIDQEKYELACKSVRTERDRLFATTVDRFNPIRWGFMKESKKKEWAEYRQALCDITSQDKFPYEVTWPVIPE